MSSFMQYQYIYQMQIIKQNQVKIDDFTLIRLIGEGNFSKVILVKHKSTMKYFAMKIQKKKKIIQKCLKNTIMNQRDILVTIPYQIGCKHPFIINLQCTFQTEKKIFYILQYCQGGDLYTLLQKQKKLNQKMYQNHYQNQILCLSNIIGIIIPTQQSNNLQRVILFKSLKLENIMIGQDGYLKLIDFGLAIKINQDQCTYCQKHLVGTIQYIPPQVITQRKYVKQNDIWMFGNIIYQMFTGLPPFYSLNTYEIFQKIKHENIKFTKQFSQESINMLSQLLQKDHLKRPKDFQQIKKMKWFNKIKWQNIINKRYKSPYKNQLKNVNDEEFYQISNNSSLVQENNLLTDFNHEKGDAIPCSPPTPSCPDQQFIFFQQNDEQNK